MRILLLSDLHLSVQGLDKPDTDADVVVLAGDLGRPAAAIEWARQFSEPTLFVAGNHEYYGSDLVSTIGQLRQVAHDSTVRVLERDEWCCGKVRFLGCTLWSDHRLYADERQRDFGIQLAIQTLHDFVRIRATPNDEQLFTPAAAQREFDRSVAWLEERFAQPHDGPTVVITHFAPSRRSIHPQFVDSPLNACFVSDLQAQIMRWQPALWLHGHTHNSFDYRIGRTRVIANPRGYAPGGKNENPLFDPTRVIDL